MSNFFKILGIIFGIVILTVLHIGAAYILPRPFSFINVIFSVILIIIFVAESGSVVWLAFFTHFVVELYSASTPFGVIIFSSTISILLAFWLHRNIITNRSWHAGVALAGIALIIYRLIFSLLILVVDIVTSGSHVFPAEFFLFFLWELIMTSLVVGLLYFILIRIWPSLEQTKTENFTISRW